MTYFQIINNEEKTICVNEKEPLFLVRICKQHSYQDSALEERAMYDLSPTGFMLYCLMSMKPPQYIWSFSVSKLPFDIDTLKKAIKELFSVNKRSGKVVYIHRILFIFDNVGINNMN